MENNDKEQKNQKQNKVLIVVLVVLLILALGVVGYIMLFKTDKNPEENKLAYTDLIKQVADGEIEEIEMTVGSTSVKVKQKNVEEEKQAIVPNTQAFIELIQEKVAEGNNIKLVQKPQNVLLSIADTLFAMLPTLLMVALIIMIFKIK